MHLPQPAKALGEMIRVTRDGGRVIACEACNNAINALVHVHETDELAHVPLSLFQGMNAHLRTQTGIDRNIGMKMPVLMHQAGLAEVQARISDAVRTSFPPSTRPRRNAPSRPSAMTAWATRPPTRRAAPRSWRS